MGTIHEHDVLVIGSGGAGLSAALHLAPHASVAVLSKGDLTATSTYYAQGGIAAVLDQTDSVDSHVEDTLQAGAGLCHVDAVRYTVENGPSSIQWLIDAGVDFSGEQQADGSINYHLTREGGHSQRRVIHSADATGYAVSNTLIDQVKKQDRVDIFTDRIAVDLITLDKLGLPGNRCIGAYVLNTRSGKIDVFRARFVILASGGASKVYLYTSNPDTATGDGIAMAWRAGCRIANLEFNQFHPTCLYHPEAKSFLITEAIRGEGGVLRLANGDRFMPRFHKRAELAPRDIVARAIDHEMKRTGADCVYLDITHKTSDFIISHFPTAYERCLELGINITSQAIPVVPAAHYTCGGIMVDLDSQTDIGNLYAIGESAFTGLHGANRMASNSLLECFVFARSAAQKIIKHLHHDFSNPPIPQWDESQVTDSDEDVIISHNWDELRRFMWDYVGIVRTNKRILRAQHRIDLLQKEINEFYRNYKISSDLVELRNLVLVADLIVQSALKRKESRGLHFTLDYPETKAAVLDSVLTPANTPTFSARKPREADLVI